MQLFKLLVLVVSGIGLPACNQGNYPEAGSCNREYPYFAVCTHGDHGVNGWSASCRASREQAQVDADRHARERHGGVSRWTGISSTDKAQLLVR